jgi:hypothetical protein
VLPALWEQWRAHGDEKWHGGDLTAFIARCSFYSPNPSGACGEGGGWHGGSDGRKWQM